jgi:two-component system OmpR family response regulator
MEPSAHILIVEDDREVGRLVSHFLGKNGLRVTVVGDGKGMDRALAERRIDLVVLDIMLPGENGLALCRRLSLDPGLPVIIVTALGSETDRIVGLEMGADDYLPKPFNPRELLARIRAVLRRHARVPHVVQSNAGSALRFATYCLDVRSRRLATLDGMRIPLTSGEFDLLLVFCQHPQKPLSRNQLLDLTRGRAAALFDRSIDIQISRLRRKIECNPKMPLLIQTIRSGGYLFTAEVISA